MNINKELYLITKKLFQTVFRSVILIYENNFVLKRRVNCLEKKLDSICEILKKNNIDISDLDKINVEEGSEIKEFSEKKKKKSNLYKEAKVLNDMIFDGDINSNHLANEVFKDFYPEIQKD